MSKPNNTTPKKKDVCICTCTPSHQYVYRVQKEVSSDHMSRSDKFGLMGFPAIAAILLIKKLIGIGLYKTAKDYGQFACAQNCT